MEQLILFESFYRQYITLIILLQCSMYPYRTIQNEDPLTPKSSNQNCFEQLEVYRIRIMELEQELSLVKHNFQIEMNQLNIKHAEKNQFFLSLIKEMQDRHNKQIGSYQDRLSNYQMDKTKMAALQYKMSQIGNGIEEFIDQSKLLSKANEELQRKIFQKDRIIQQMAADIQNLNEQVQQYQMRIENYQKSKLKYIKRNKDIGQLILEAQVSISSLTPAQDNIRASAMMCASTGHKSSECNHCKLANLQKKYSKLLN